MHLHAMLMLIQARLATRVDLGFWILHMWRGKFGSHTPFVAIPT